VEPDKSSLIFGKKGPNKCTDTPVGSERVKALKKSEPRWSIAWQKKPLYELDGMR